MTSQLTEEQNTKLRQLEPFGWELMGLNIAETVSSEIVNLIKQRLAHSGVVVLRNQFVNDDDFVGFLKRLGTLTFTTGETPVAHQPMLNVVTNVGRATPPRSVFHTDTSYVQKPPNYTALRAIALPSTGGETLFCNQYRAYETLPTWVKEQLSDSKLLHVVSGLTLSEQDEQQAWHPLFRRHPISNKISLFLSTPERCVKISGLSTDISPDNSPNISSNISKRVIRLLYKHSIRSAYIYRHYWHEGDIVIWDNRCTLHRADHSRVVGDRILHRGLIAGEAPIPA
ncbi:MAG: TauD/TfdA family dioxygenase [Cyanobacteria bacterium J06649_4]